MKPQQINYHIKDVTYNELQIIDGMLVKDGIGITFNFSLTETDTGAKIIVRSTAKMSSDHPTKFVQSDSSITYDYFSEPVTNMTKIDKKRLTELIFQQVCRHAAFVHIKTGMPIIPPSLSEIFQSLHYIP